MICVVCRCVLVLTVCMGGSGGYSECGWVCNGCVYFVGWLEWINININLIA